MSELEVTDAATESVRADDVVPAGAILRAAREAQGLHIAALAVALKVPVKKLEALEASNYDELPDTVFVRSLALSVCRALKINPDQVLSVLPTLPAHGIKSINAGLNVEFKSMEASAQSSVRAQLSGFMGLGVAVLLLAIPVVLLWQEGAEILSAISPPEPTQLVSTVPSQEATVGSDLIVPSPPAKPDIAASAVEVAPILPDVIEFKAHGASWVEVLDADGVSRLNKEMADGEVLSVTGKLPLSVTVGSVDKILVLVRGQELDIKSLARQNVAKFQVK